MSRVKIAFVASGGAARGLAHLGVLRACEELGLLPEVFVGTSAGAVVGAMYAQDIPLDVMLDGYRLPWRRRHEGPRLHFSTFMGAPTRSELLDPGHLFSGLLSIRKFERYMRQHLPINSFRRLAKPVFVTAVDLDTAERAVFGPGYNDDTPISEAVAASCCVPGLFRPMRIKGRYYIDGEVARTLSADLAVEAGANVVIISNIYRPVRQVDAERAIARRGINRVLRQSLSILLTEKERRGVQLLSQRFPHVTFIDIAPDLGPYGYLNRFAARSLILRGYGTALRALANAKESHIFDHLMPVDSHPGLRSVG
ncbi:MAG TPA: patatin-like phospholipase family protein [Polyangiaceae bacterium]|jgi:NTE family protein|nr:patatin-like phospholipase family protein [Polyangiaceae bacterium]